jgi:hypothetical protein
LLPPIVFPAEPIDVSKGKVSGGMTVPGDSDSSSDSQEDKEDEDTHKLHKLSQAAQKEIPTIVEVRGDYQWDGRFHEVIFAKEFKGAGKPSHILEPLQAAYKQIGQIGKYYRGGGTPQSCVWTSAGLPRDQIGVSVSKRGSGIHIPYGYHGSTALDMANNPSRVRVELMDGRSLSGHQKHLGMENWFIYHSTVE